MWVVIAFVITLWFTLCSPTSRSTNQWLLLPNKYHSVTTSILCCWQYVTCQQCSTWCSAEFYYFTILRSWHGEQNRRLSVKSVVFLKFHKILQFSLLFLHFLIMSQNFTKFLHFLPWNRSGPNYTHTLSADADNPLTRKEMSFSAVEYPRM